MILNRTGYCYSDLQIVPSVVSHIRSRSECNPFYSGRYELPIFTAPMDSVCDHNNYGIFEQNGIIPIIHRNVPLEKRIELTRLGKWCAYRLSEIETLFNEENSQIYDTDLETVKCLIDIANGHMSYVFELAESIKKTAEKMGKKLEVMTGNIANPETYRKCCQAGIDYVRCSIGTGSLCLTSSNTACGGYPNATLIDKIVNEERPNCKFRTKIIADGGIKNYNDAIIALALGADYVMIGGLFSTFIESCGGYKEETLCPETIEQLKKTGLGFYNGKFQNKHNFVVLDNTETRCSFELLVKRYGLDLENFVYGKDFGINIMSVSLTETQIQMYDDVKNWLFKYVKITKPVHGMSSKEAQIASLKCENKPVELSVLKTSEGKSEIREVNSYCKKWTDNFISYMTSAMSYTDCRTIEEFIEKNHDLIVRSYGTQISVNK